MSLLKFILRFAAPLPDLESFSRYLFIGPHPDDIEIGCGATVSKLVQQGKDVSFLICTDGRYGLNNAPEGTTPEALAETRKKEAIKSARALGVDDVHFLDLSDGGLYSIDDLNKGIAGRIGIFKPDVVFAVDPDVTSECHIDHLNVGNSAKHMVCYAPYRQLIANYSADSADVKAIALYMTAKPNRFVGTRGHVKQQLDAIFGYHKSQYPDGCSDIQMITKYIWLRSVFFGIRSLKGNAEGFRVLDKTRMHCMPEGGN